MLNTAYFNDVVWGMNFYYNGILVAKATGAYSFSSSNTESFKFFKGRSNSSATMKVSYIRMYDDDVLVRDMLPACKNDAYGMYDRLNDVFYGNAGTGSFTHGNALATPDSVIVAGSPVELGVPEPNYGNNSGLEAGESRTLRAPAGSYPYNGKVYTCTGWELYAISSFGVVADTPYRTGDTLICEYEHPDPASASRLVWKFEITGDAVSSTTNGSWDDPAIWSNGRVPSIGDAVIVNHSVYCTNDLYAASLTVSSSGTLWFHVRTDTGVANPVPYYMDKQDYTFDVAGNVTVNGGGLALHGARTPSSITNLNIRIGGDLALTGSARMGVAAATYSGQDVSTSNLYNIATVVDVGGKISVGDTSILYPFCDMVVGCAVKFKCASFVLAGGAEVRARERGWYWYSKWITTRDPRETWCAPTRGYYTFARGAGMDTPRIGAGHGGRGSGENGRSGCSYGLKYAPYLPGSPAGGDSGYSENYDNANGCGRGGGVFWLVTSGKATINGTITAHALNTSWQAASGGSVWIAADEFDIGGLASINAKGGNAGGSSVDAIGGGGRVSLALKLTQAELDALAKGEEPSNLVYSEPIVMIPCNVSAGTPQPNSTKFAEDGTTTLVTRGDTFTPITIASSGPHANTVTPNYGDHALATGEPQTFTAPQYGIDAADDSWRYECLGYVVSNATEEVASGEALSFNLTITEPVTVTWIWGETEYTSYLKIIGNGHFTLDGTDHGVTNIHLKASWPNVLTAVPEDGYEFLYWTGMASEANRCNPVLVLPAAEQKHVTAVFRATAAQGRHEWKADAVGDFHNAANWDDGIVPGVADTAVIGSGTCSIPEYLKVAALEVTGGTVKTKLNAKQPGYTNNVVDVTGNVTLSGNGKLQLGATDGSSQMYNTLNVGGNLVLEDTSFLLLTAGRREAGYTWKTGSGFVNVAGNFRIDDQAVFTPNCDGFKGGGVKTTVGGSFRVAEGAKVDAKGRGNGVYGSFALGWSAGMGDQGIRGSAHGGRATSQSGGVHSPASDTYDYLYAPMMPGQQNRESEAKNMTRGGGVVRVVASSITIDGTVTAEGNSCIGGNTSGGSIWLTSFGALNVGPNADITAKGTYDADLYAAGGASGGGRISLCRYVKPFQLEALTASPNAIPEKLKDITDDFLAEHPSYVAEQLKNGSESETFTNVVAVAPGAPGLGFPSCWGTFKVLSGNKGGLTLILK